MKVSMIVRQTKASLHDVAQALTSRLSMWFHNGKQTLSEAASGFFEFGPIKVNVDYY